jgi:Amt family ammonium transporter
VETSALINSLRQIGCTFALDDFGRGMSSFMYLKELRVDYLKIDGEFVRNMVDDPVSRAMVQAIHALGRAMHIATIAEWVETPTLRHLIETLGIDYMQGYELGKPEPLTLYLERQGRAMSARAPQPNDGCATPVRALPSVVRYDAMAPSRGR